MNTNNLLNY